MTRIEMFFDVSSPWTYLAFENIQPLAREFSVDITWRPFLVGGVFNTINPSVYQSRENPVPAKEAYMAVDLANWARFTGVNITWRPSVFPVNSVKAMRGCLVAAREDKLVPFARACFESYWSRDRDISSDDVLAEICTEAGLSPETLFAGIQEPDIKQALRANGDELVSRGGFGTPTIFVDGTKMFFGNDRMPLVRAALVK
jgi:2-hydroxychromene-2-carboxylate isomerase